MSEKKNFPEFIADSSGFGAEDGQALVEYALILLLVALVTIGALTAIGTSVSGIINNIAGAF